MATRYYYLIWFLIGIIYTINLTLDVMEVDAAQYAAMSAEMHESGSYLHVYHRGQDYLDKPPLLFWLASASFSLFGVNNVAYKLPALIALLIGVWSMYRFTLLYDKKETALLAVTILGSTQAFFQMTNDVRTDGLLTGFVMFAVYHSAAWLRNKRISHLVLAGVGVGLAMLAKGPIGAIIPVLALCTDRLLKGKWKDLFKWHWSIVIVVALLILAPMCYGLYTQFDLHPEKTAYGLQSPSGLRFFFWTQSFGRVTGEIYWDNNAPFYFFLLTFLWDFMPWVLIFFSAFIYAIRRSMREGRNYPEYFTLGGLILVWILLSFSKYKLPHYIFPLFPFAAVLTARYVSTLTENRGHILSTVQFIFLHLFFITIAIVFFKGFPPGGILVVLAVATGFVCMWIAFWRFREPFQRILLVSSITAITFNLFMAIHLYPNLLRYQSGSVAGKLIFEDKKANEREYYTYLKDSFSTDFYSGHYLQSISENELPSVPTDSWIYTTEEGKTAILSTYPDQFAIVHAFDHYHISMLKLKFVLKESRASVLQKRYILEKQ